MRRCTAAWSAGACLNVSRVASADAYTAGFVKAWERIVPSDLRHVVATMSLPMFVAVLQTSALDKDVVQHIGSPRP